MSRTPERPDRSPRDEKPASGDRGGRAPTPPPKNRRQAFTWLTLLALVVLMWVVMTGTSRGMRKIETFQQFSTYLKEDKVKPGSVVIEDTRIVAEIKPGTPGFEASGDKGTPVFVSITPGEFAYYQDKLDEMGVGWEADAGSSIWVQLLVGIAPVLLLLLIVWFFIARSVRAAGGGPGGMLGSFGKSRHRVGTKDTVSVTFNDVAGIDEAKEEVTELVEFLKNPKR
ncbi:MAG: hypothetical protein ACO4BU_06200, partial [Phycisphaerales bacterium]